MRGKLARRVVDRGLSPLATGLVLSPPLLASGHFAGLDVFRFSLSWLLLLAAIDLLFRRSAGENTFGPANGLTLARLGLVLLLFSTAASGTSAAGSWSVFSIALCALLLDAVDGRVARRLGGASRFGARFDLETDAAFLFATGLLLWTVDRAGFWVLAVGLLRPLFLLAGRLYPPLARPLPPRRRRAFACGIAASLLTFALLPPLPPAVPASAAALAVLLLLGSFALDIHFLLARR